MWGTKNTQETSFIPRSRLICWLKAPFTPRLKRESSGLRGNQFAGSSKETTHKSVQILSGFCVHQTGLYPVRLTNNNSPPRELKSYRSFIIIGETDTEGADLHDHGPKRVNVIDQSEILIQSLTHNDTLHSANWKKTNRYTGMFQTDPFLQRMHILSG